MTDPAEKLTITQFTQQSREPHRWVSWNGFHVKVGPAQTREEKRYIDKYVRSMVAATGNTDLEEDQNYELMCKVTGMFRILDWDPKTCGQEFSREAAILACENQETFFEAMNLASERLRREELKVSDVVKND